MARPASIPHRSGSSVVVGPGTHGPAAAPRSKAPANGIHLIAAAEHRWLLAADLALLQDHAVAPGIEQLGWVAHGSLPPIYPGTLSLVFPSLQKGFGLPILEARGSGCTVPTSNRSAIAATVGDAGLLFDLQRIEAIADGMKAWPPTRRPEGA